MSDPQKHKTDREAKAKIAQKRIASVEKHFGQICATMGSIARKNARLRDKGDLLARHLMSYAESDKLNSTTRSSVYLFAENYSVIQDYCHAKVQRMETKVLKPLMKYGELCRYVKRSVKSELTACGKEKKVLQKLEKLKEKSSSQTQIAELELDRVQGEEQVVGEAMDVEVDKFEKDKLMDIKSLLTELVQIEMLYHAKALEYLSKCFENVEAIDVDTDLDEYHNGIGQLRKQSRGDTSARSQRIRMDASTLTTTGSTTRSSDTRASGTFSSSYLSSMSRSRQSQSLSPSPRRQHQAVQPSPRGGQTNQTRPSPRVRISGLMYQDADDEDSEDEEEEDY